MKALNVAVGIAVAVAGVSAGVPVVRGIQRDRIRNGDRDDVKAIAVAMSAYRDQKGHLPPAVVYGPDGVTPHSWRVELLPLLGEDALYKDYRQNEPWDSAHNRALLGRMPAVFRSGVEPSTSTAASYFVMTGPKTAFATSDGLSNPEITDPWDSLITVVSARRDVPWTKPEDIEFDDYAAVPALGGHHEGGFFAATASGQVRFFSKHLDSELLTQMIVACDGLPHGCEF